MLNKFCHYVSVIFYREDLGFFSYQNLNWNSVNGVFCLMSENVD